MTDGGKIEDLRRFILRSLSYDDPPDTLTPDLPLIDSKVLDSLAIAQLVNYIEDEYDIEIPPEDLNKENFSDLEAIAQLIETKLS